MTDSVTMRRARSWALAESRTSAVRLRTQLTLRVGRHMGARRSTVFMMAAAMHVDTRTLRTKARRSME